MAHRIRHFRDYVRSHPMALVWLMVIIAFWIVQIIARQVWGYRFPFWSNIVTVIALIGLLYIDWKAAREA